MGGDGARGSSGRWNDARRDGGISRSSPATSTSTAAAMNGCTAGVGALSSDCLPASACAWHRFGVHALHAVAIGHGHRHRLDLRLHRARVGGDGELHEQQADQRNQGGKDSMGTAQFHMLRNFLHSISHKPG